MGPKYEFTEQTLNYDGHILHQIRRLSDGELGGWIESENNLNQDDDCWVADNGKVFENAELSGDSIVCGNAQVFGNAVIIDSKICDNAKVYDNASIYTSQVCDNAEVCGNVSLHNYSKVYENAIVFDNVYTEHSEIYGNARVYGHAKLYESEVYNTAQVYDNAVLHWHSRVYNSAQVYGDAVLNRCAKVYENAKVFGKTIVNEYVEIHGDVELNVNKKVKDNMFSNALLKSLKLKNSEKIANIIKLLNHYPDHKIPIDQDGYVKYTVVKLTKENLDMDVEFEHQLRSEGKYGWYTSCTCHGDGPITMKNLAIFGDPNRWVTKWMYSDREEAIKKDLVDKNFRIYARIVEYQPNADILETL